MSPGAPRFYLAQTALAAMLQLPQRASIRFSTLFQKLRNDPSANGINFESIEGARDRYMKSVRVDDNHRAIIYARDGIMVALYVDKHDDAYAWASGRRMEYNPATGAVELVPVANAEAVRTDSAPAKGASVPRLLAGVSDRDLSSIGVVPDLIPFVRGLRDEVDLEAARSDLPPAVYDGLVGLASGMSVDEVKDLLSPPEKPVDDFAEAMETDQSRRSFWLVETDEELERMIASPLEVWRIFLHPSQRRVVEKPTTGPAMVRGGAGTGKTVVAMHRARWLAENDAVCAKSSDRILFTTFTSNLAADIEANLDRLCVGESRKRIEVKNLDRWVSEFLRKQGYERRIVYNQRDLDGLWDEALGSADIELGRDFVIDEWRQVVQANGIMDEAGYVKVTRAGRGTPVDRRTRLKLWKVFQNYRALLDEKGLAEVDDAYRDARALLTKPAHLPYRAIVVDEAQDMGAEAFRLIRAIVPPTPEGDDNSIFIVGDGHQRIYQRRASMKTCGIDIVGRSTRLKVNYRTSNEIRNWATGILEGMSVDDMDGALDTLAGATSRFHGPEPILIGGRTFSEEMQKVMAWISDLVSSGVRPEEICVLARSRAAVDRARQEIVKDRFGVHVLDGDQSDDRGVKGVRLATMHRSKGLEFEAIVLVGMNAVDVPPKPALDSSPDAAAKREVEDRERSLIHVAATRAKRHLMVTWNGERTRLIK
ncbi:UvrD-helicase domain-containing protein [Methylorubrum extorquens]